jgi:hypothetical protein
MKKKPEPISLMLYTEIAVLSAMETTDTLCGQNVEFLNVKPGGT